MSDHHHECVFQTSDGSVRRVRVSRVHPAGRFVPGVRFLCFEDLSGTTLGVAGIPSSRTILDIRPEQLERLLAGAVRFHPAGAQRAA